MAIERPDGAQRWVCINYMPLGDDTLAAGGLLWSFTDVTESRDSERVQREAEERLQTVVSGADVIIGMVDADGVFTLSEGHRLRRLGLQPQALVGRRFDEVYAGNAEALEQCRRALAGERFEAETKIGELCFHTHYSPVLAPDGTVSGVIAVSTDVTDRRRDKDRLEFLAFHDELTGAPKRGVLEQHLTTALHEARMAGTALAVLHLDLDGFKVVNDTIGLSGSDELLREVAARLRARWDPAFARPTADEFLIVVPGLGADVEVGATAAAREVLDCLEQPFAIADTEFEMAGTIGVAVFPRDGETSAELLQHADTAVRYAKRTARGGHAFYDAQKDRRVGRLTLNARMRRALKRDEFVLYYQPVFDVATGRTQGVEALLRWNDPQAGMIPPGDFIPAAEDSGLIVPIGEWVINAVLAQSAAWAAEGLHPQIAFNVSPRQLQATGFGDGLIAAVEAGGVDPKRLVVEITESAAMADPDRTRPLLDRLTATGMRLAIDDFGADFSSLARLRDLPADALKIDRAFLRGVPDDRCASEIVVAILSLARALDLQAVAEGVEEQAQLDFLQRRGCPWAQGFHLARPMPAAAVTPLLRAD